jgi:hypothetical protein
MPSRPPPPLRDYSKTDFSNGIARIVLKKSASEICRQYSFRDAA